MFVALARRLRAFRSDATFDEKMKRSFARVLTPKSKRVSAVGREGGYRSDGRGVIQCLFFVSQGEARLEKRTMVRECMCEGVSEHRTYGGGKGVVGGEGEKIIETKRKRKIKRESQTEREGRRKRDKERERQREGEKEGEKERERKREEKRGRERGREREGEKEGEKERERKRGRERE